MRSNCLRVVFALALVLVWGSVTRASVIAAWTFENIGADQDNVAAFGPIAATTGTGESSGLHGSATTDYSSPAGNASANSFSSNTWTTVGDHYQFKLSTLGFENLLVSFDQTRSSTGPSAFQFQHSPDGVTFTSINYVVLENGAAPNAAWSSGGARQSAYTLSFDLNAVAALDNDSEVFFRLTSTAVAAAGGTNRVDNFQVEGTEIANSTVPEPSSLTIFSLGAISLAYAAWRRRKSG